MSYVDTTRMDELIYAEEEYNKLKNERSKLLYRTRCLIISTLCLLIFTLIEAVIIIKLLM